MQYAIKIRKSDLQLITLLNGDVEPKIEKKTTYLVFDVDPDGLSSKILTEREFISTYEISSNSPLLLKLKK